RPPRVETAPNWPQFTGPQFLHVVTKKGKGFAPAELDPIGYHAITKLQAPGSAPKKTGGPKYSTVYGQWLCDMAAQDAR
ncbi:1-deoxy-D-xylulose-5-phosphate synthase, partial [Pseudomonas aeruginosa]